MYQPDFQFCYELVTLGRVQQFKCISVDKFFTLRFSSRRQFISELENLSDWFMLSSSHERATPALLSSGRISLGVNRFLVFVRFFPRKFAALSRPPKRIIQERNNVTTVKVTRQKNATFTKFIEIVECLCS